MGKGKTKPVTNTS